MIRKPAVAGTFYPADAHELARQVDEYSRASNSDYASAAKTRAIACIVPHAGYVYSGHVAGAVYAALEIPDRCVLIGPRHFPQGQPLSILTEGAWQTPLGEAPIDEAMARSLAHAFPRLREDPLAHEREHALEVQLPFLQMQAKNLRFVPVLLATDRYPVLDELGKAVAKVIREAAGQTLLIASTDMNHYESDAETRVKDESAIEQIVALNPRGLYDAVRDRGITMCGYAATVAVLVAARELGATEARLVKYATSGDVNGDRTRVVGYAGFVIR